MFQHFQQLKEEGKLPPFTNISNEDLKQLFLEEEISDGRIAELFDIKTYQVSNRRRKNGITPKEGLIHAVLHQEGQESMNLSNEIKEGLFTPENVDFIAKAVAHFAFRNGPIEDKHVHANHQLSDKDMKELNQFTVNRLAYLFDLMIKNDWFRLKVLIDSHKMYGGNLDDSVPDDGGNEKLVQQFLEKYKND